jgi:hypothetical protein
MGKQSGLLGTLVNYTRKKFCDNWPSCMFIIRLSPRSVFSSIFQISAGPDDRMSSSTVELSQNVVDVEMSTATSTRRSSRVGNAAVAKNDENKSTDLKLDDSTGRFFRFFKLKVFFSFWMFTVREIAITSPCVKFK